MDFVNTIIDWVSAGVMLFGAGIAISGLQTYGEGKSQNSSAKQEEGTGKAIGGIFIVLVGLLLVPQIVNMLPS